MADLVTAATTGFASYYFYEFILSLFTAYKMSTDARFKTPNRYVYAAALLFIPLIDYFYLGHLGYRNRDILKKYWNGVRSIVGKIKKV